MPTIKNLLLILVAILLTQLWLTTPSLNHYSLQLFAVTFLGYFIVKKINKTKPWQVIPKGFSLELFFITPAVLLLTGATGGLESFFYPITYAYLLVIAISCTTINTTVISIALTLFYYSLNTSLSSHEVANLITLLIAPIFFIFIKQQYQDVKVSHYLLKKEEKELKKLSSNKTILEDFIINFITPKLNTVKKMLINHPSTTDLQVIKNQLSLIQNEGEKILKNINDEEK